ncbi:MAG TPA: glycosyltransferase 87 family protein [Gaiella sp.]|nr:glycosyltransferase 87 family protein [Gaiella sp.]
MTARPALVAGLATACLVGTASLVAWRAGSPLVPRDGGTAEQGSAWWFLVLLVLAFACYLGGLALLRNATPAFRAVAVVAVLVQLVPLGAPLLLSTDAWTYWSYGWIASQGGGNPYVDPPSEFPENPAGPYMGAAWRDTTTVYGPVFTGVSEPVAAVAGSSSDAAAWLYKSLAALGLLAACAAVAASSGRSSLAVAFVGWNPVLAVHAAGGGHNDALVGGLAALAVALALRRRHDLSGAVWVLAVLVKWVPLVFLALASLAARARARPLGVRGVVGAAVLLSALATWLYGVDWLRAAEPLAGNAARETSYALPSRLEHLGLPHGVALGVSLAGLVAGLFWLARDATHGRVRLGLAACLVLVTTPYLAVWYLAWAVPLAAPEEERASRLAALALTAYLLPQTIPL